jgi:hypothetical protein
MDSPKYNINISYQPSVSNGQQYVVSGGVTQSYTTTKYTSDYYIASMPEVKLYATGSSYTASLSNLLALAASASNIGYPPLSNTRTW